MIHLLFLLSGVSGLVYQVVWVREFGAVFGNTVHSAAIVTAVFMGGLGLGSWLIGRYSDRRHGQHPTAALRAYGRAELAIGLLGLGVAWLLPRLEGLSASFSQYATGPEGWFEVTTSSYLLRYATATALLLPITLLMGGTLTLLIRHLVGRQVSQAGWRVATLYGLNTAGAALGAFLSDFALIPNLGIFRTEGVAVALNLVAGAGALLLARVPGGTRSHASPSLPESPGGGSDRVLLGTAATLFVTGFVAMGFEIVWFRHLISYLGGYRSTFSLLMTVILVGIFLGSILGGLLERRTRRPAALFLCAQTAFVLFALGPLAILGPTSLLQFVPTQLDALSPALRNLFETLTTAASIAGVVAPGALLMGCTFPLSNAHVQRVASAVGGRAGLLYLANTAGNVAGSLVTAFVLLPGLGQQASLSTLGLLAMAGLVPLYATARRRGQATERVPAALFVGCQAALVLGLVVWLQLPEHHLVRHVRGAAAMGQRVVAVSEGINETALVLERQGGRWLYTNGHPMSGSAFGSERYMRLFSHLPLLAMEHPTRVLVICFGVGNTLHAASLHDTVDTLHVVDLSKNVLRQARHFEAGNRGVLRDERVSVFVNDGRQHLRLQPPDFYDLITLEPPPITHAGIASLYSSEFYELARSRLTSGGYMTQWLPAYQVSGAMNLSIIRSFVDVFPNALLLSGAGRELVLIGSKNGSVSLDPARVQAHLEQNPDVQEDLESVGAGSLTALVATFVAGPVVIERATSGAPPVTDDRPLMEYSTGSSFVRTRLPGELFDDWELREWCPACFDGRRPIAELAELPALLDALRVYYHSEAFLSYSNYLEPTPKPFQPTEPCRLESVQQSSYFARLFDCGP